MALIYCPECGVQLSDKAEKCPNCAYPINKEFSPIQKTQERPQIIVKSKDGCFLQTLNIGCVIVLIIIGIIILTISILS